jgi:hypothetical protein
LASAAAACGQRRCRESDHRGPQSASSSRHRTPTSLEIL